VFKISIHKGSLWALRNATVVFLYKHEGIPLVQKYQSD
jgi:hypothetical protein